MDSLSVSWKPGPGRAEQFRILLRDSAGMGSVWNATVNDVTIPYMISSLSPGRVYNMSIITEAAGMQTAVSLQEQTGTFYYE